MMNVQNVYLAENEGSTIISHLQAKQEFSLFFLPPASLPSGLVLGVG